MGLPPGVAGIPVWYQDTFFYGLCAMGIIGCITLLLSWTGKLHPVRWNVNDLAFLILLSYMVIRISLSIRMPSVQEFIPQTAWIQVVFLAGCYGISRMLWPSINRKSFHILISLLLLAGITEAIYGLGQLYGLWPSHHHLFPLTGSFFNPGPYSGWLACVVPVAVYGILQKKASTGHQWVNYLSWAYLFLAVLVLFPASSRAAILAAVAGTVVVSWPRIKITSLWQHNWVKGTVASVLIMGLAGLYLMKKDSADGRLLIYKVTAKMIVEAPLLGWGWDGFPVMYNNFQAVYFENDYGSQREKYLADNVTFGFNEVLEFTAEMGILGLLLAVGVVALVIRKWRQQVKTLNIHPIHYLGPGVMAAWVVFALFSYPLSIPALALILPVTLSGINTALSKDDSPPTDGVSAPNTSLVQRTAKIVTGLLLLCISAYGIYWINHYRPLAREWMAANANQELHYYETANNLYQQLYPDFRHEGLFLQYAGKSYSLARHFYASAQMLERALFFSADPTIFTTLGEDYTLFSKVDPKKKERAEFLLNRAKYISPYKYYPRYLLTKLYERMGKKDKAVEEAEGLLAIEPKIPSPATREIRQEMQQIIDQEIFQPKEMHFSVEKE